MNRFRIALAAVAFAAATGAHGHGALQQQIDNATAALTRDPANVELYLRRGELHRVHEDPDAALADFDRAAALAPAEDAIDFLRGRALQEAGRAAAAKIALDRFLARHPNHADALIVRARAMRALAAHGAAVSDFSRAIEWMPRPDPDIYLERARVELARNDPDRALAGIDAGIGRIGDIASLQTFALDIELQQGRVDAALARLDRIARQSQRRETWLARRGEILAQAGRTQEARAAYESALGALGALPARARWTPAMVGLEVRVRSALIAL